MKRVFHILTIALISTACTDFSVCPSSEGDDDWLNKRIRGFKNSDSKAEVYYYEYDGQPVYSINSCIDCPDSMTVVYNCSEGVVCQFGGIGGLNTCPDWEDKAKNGKLIYKNY